MDANEPPIGDGSSAPYVELIKSVGREEQDKPAKVWEIREPIHFDNGRGSTITIVPDKKFRVSVTNIGPDGRFTQFFSSEVNPDYRKRCSNPR